MIVTTFHVFLFSIGNIISPLTHIALTVFDRSIMMIFSLLENVSTTTKIVNREENNNLYLEKQIGL